MKDWIAFVERHGVVMQSARHATVPSLADAIAGEEIRGSWWGHKKGQDIFRALQVVYGSPDVVAVKLIDNKLTLVHRRLWPALATLAYEGRLAKSRLTKITQEHTAAGRHEKREERFPDWLPRALKLPSLPNALALLGPLSAVIAHDPIKRE